jgi:hypothetical protein
MVLVYQRTGACQGWLSVNVMIVMKKIMGLRQLDGIVEVGVFVKRLHSM